MKKKTLETIGGLLIFAFLLYFIYLSVRQTAGYPVTEGDFIILEVLFSLILWLLMITCAKLRREQRRRRRNRNQNLDHNPENLGGNL